MADRPGEHGDESERKPSAPPPEASAPAPPAAGWLPYPPPFPPPPPGYVLVPLGLPAPPPSSGDKKRTALWVSLIVGLVVIVLVSCAAGGAALVNRVSRLPAYHYATPTPLPEAAFTTTGQPAPDEEQVFNYAALGSPANLTLVPDRANYTFSKTLIALIFPGLFVTDAQARLVPWAARSWEVSPDGKTYTFHLRPGMRWSDGVPIDAGTFAYSLNRLLDPCTNTQIYYVGDIEGAGAFWRQGCDNSRAIPTLIGRSLIVADPQTLIVKLSAPTAYFPAVLADSSTYAVPQQLIALYGLNWASHLTDGAGFGGNLFTLVQAGATSYTFRRNEAFWGTKPKLREIRFTLYRDFTAEYTAFRQGAADVGYLSGYDYADAMRFHRGDMRQVSLLYLYYLQMNWLRAPFDDVRMRQAFALALDKQDVADAAAGGIVRPTNHIIPQGMVGYNDGLTGPDGTQSLTGNQSRARALAQAYAKDKCGGKLNACPAVTLTLPQTDTYADNAMREALSMWKLAIPGYRITISHMANSIFYSDARQCSLQFFYRGWFADYSDPRDMLSWPFLPESDSNAGCVNDPPATALLKQADAEQDAVARIREYNQAEQLLVNDVAWLPLYQQTYFYRVRDYVTGYAASPLDIVSLDTFQSISILQHSRT